MAPVTTNVSTWTTFLQLQILKTLQHVCVRKVWRYQRGNQSCKIRGQLKQWPKEGQTDKLWFTIPTWKMKDWRIWTPLKTKGELKCFGSVNSSSSTKGTKLILNKGTKLTLNKGTKLILNKGTKLILKTCKIFH